jgi:hypothetical protein
MATESGNIKVKKGTVRGRGPLPERPIPSGDLASLKARHAARHQLILSPESVNFKIDAANGEFEWDFQSIYDEHPRLQTLLLQLIKGFHMHYGSGTLKKGSMEEGCRAIQKFIEFLISPTAVLPQQVGHIADINRQVALSFRS